MAWIKKIQDSQGTQHDIDAKRWDGHDFSEVIDLVHGVVDTYVIPTSNKDLTGYADVVNSTSSTVTISKTNLKALVGFNKNDAGGDTIDHYDMFKIGDIILVEALSNDSTNKGEKAFDRWISAYNQSTDMYTLSVLETQVATHHHTIGTTTSKALTGMNNPTKTATIPVVGSAVSVVTSVTGTFVTSVELSGGSDTLAISHTSGTGSVSHRHTVDSHSHNITPSTLVSQTVGAYTTLTSKNHTPHSHSTASVAGAHVDASSPITIVTASNGSDTFVKTLSQTPTNTTSVSLTTGANTAGLTTTAQTSSDTITSDIQTLSSGAHTHTVSTTTTENVVKTVDLAPNVVTSVNYTKPTVAGTVVTSVSTKSQLVATSWSAAPTTTVVTSTSWSCGVIDEVLVFSFGASTGSAVTSATKISGSANVTVVNGTISTTTQSAGSCTVTSDTQSHTSGTVSATGSAASSGAHTHGFGHTHAIASHTHGIAHHVHKYDKATVGTSSKAITSLSTTTYTPHTHETVTVAATAVNGTSFKYITGGSTTTVVQNLKDTAVATTSSNPGTNAVYTNLTGEVIFPGLTAPTGSVNVSRQTITPAAAGTEQAIKSITFASSNFVTGLTSTGTNKTSKNIGGE